MNKPLSYNAFKSVLKSISFEKRQQIHRRIPQLRTTNSILPYRVKNVTIGWNNIQIDSILWMFRNAIETLGTVNGMVNRHVIPNETDLTMQHICEVPEGCPYNLKKSPCIRLNKTPDDAYIQLFETFLKNNTAIVNSGVYSGICETKKFIGLES